jgi:hypothetical protein
MLRFSSSLDVLAGERGLGDLCASLEAAGDSTTGVWEVRPVREVRVAIV